MGPREGSGEARTASTACGETRRPSRAREGDPSPPPLSLRESALVIDEAESLCLELRLLRSLFHAVTPLVLFRLHFSGFGT